MRAFDYAVVVDDAFLNAYAQKTAYLEEMHKYNLSYQDL